MTNLSFQKPHRFYALVTSLFHAKQHTLTTYVLPQEPDQGQLGGIEPTQVAIRSQFGGQFDKRLRDPDHHVGVLVGAEEFSNSAPLCSGDACHPRNCRKRSVPFDSSHLGRGHRIRRLHSRPRLMKKPPPHST